MISVAMALAVVVGCSAVSQAQSLSGGQPAPAPQTTRVAQLETIDTTCSPERVGLANVAACRTAFSANRDYGARRGTRVTIRSCTHLGCKGVHLLGVGY
jgi:hypothetical protein